MAAMVGDRAAPDLDPAQAGRPDRTPACLTGVKAKHRDTAHGWTQGRIDPASQERAGGAGRSMFKDRTEAGQRLAGEIAKLSLHDPVVLALPRGGVPVADAIAGALNAALDLVIVRKVGAPGNPELAVAAIVDGNPPDVVLNRAMVEAYGLSEEELDELVKRERPELDRRAAAYRGRRKALSVTDKTAILVDDGAATGTTMRVAIRAMRRRSPRAVVVALPIAPAETVQELRLEADRVVCLSEPAQFRALSLHYRDFHQLTDAEVTQTLHAAARRRRAVLDGWKKRKTPD